MFNRRIRAALHLRGEVRSDGLPLMSASSKLQLDWQAREIHPWDKALQLKDPEARFVNQAIKDTEAVVCRLFATLPHIDVIAIRVFQPHSGHMIMSGEVLRSSLAEPRPLSGRMWLGQLGIRFYLVENRSYHT